MSPCMLLVGWILLGTDQQSQRIIFPTFRERRELSSYLYVHIQTTSQKKCRNCWLQKRRNFRIDERCVGYSLKVLFMFIHIHVVVGYWHKKFILSQMLVVCLESMFQRWYLGFKRSIQPTLLSINHTLQEVFELILAFHRQR